MGESPSDHVPLAHPSVYLHPLPVLPVFRHPVAPNPVAMQLIDSSNAESSSSCDLSPPLPPEPPNISICCREIWFRSAAGARACGGIAGTARPAAPR